MRESAADPCRGCRARRALRRPAPVQEAALHRGRGHRRRPAAAHDVPAVPAGGGGRQHLAAALAWCRCGASCKRCHVLSGEVTRIEHARKTATVQPIVGPAARGRRTTTSSWRPARCRGPCRSRACARTRSASRPSARPSTCATTCWTGSTWRRPRPTQATRRRALTFVFVGGGYAGIEALAEMEDMARDALRYYPSWTPDDMRWVLVEATQRILPEVGPRHGRLHGASSCASAAWTSGWTPGWSPVWTAS